MGCCCNKQTPKSVDSGFLILLLFAPGHLLQSSISCVKGISKSTKLTSWLIPGPLPMVQKTLTYNRCFWQCGPQTTSIRTEQAKKAIPGLHPWPTATGYPLAKSRNCHFNKLPGGFWCDWSWETYLDQYPVMSYKESRSKEAMWFFRVTLLMS